MRLIFEIGDLKTATPATVSRAGILFLNYTDVGWNPYVFSFACLTFNSYEILHRIHVSFHRKTCRESFKFKQMVRKN